MNMDLANKAAFISQDWQSNKYLQFCMSKFAPIDVKQQMQ